MMDATYKRENIIRALELLEQYERQPGGIDIMLTVSSMLGRPMLCFYCAADDTHPEPYSYYYEDGPLISEFPRTYDSTTRGPFADGLKALEELINEQH